MSHTLLSLIDPKTNQPFPGTQRRVAIFAKMLRSGIPQSFNWMRSQPFQQSMHVPFQDKLDNSGIINIHPLFFLFSPDK